MINQLYERFQSDESCTLPCKEVYTDRYGYPNENAFHSFTESLIDNDEDYYLVCLNIDLRKANSTSMAQGDYVLRKFILSLNQYYVFRIRGEKFNMLVTKEQIPEVKERLDTPNEKYQIYYGIVKDAPFKPHNSVEEKALIQKGIALMYECKIEKSAPAPAIIDTKGNTPKELQEDKLRKYRSTMWYSTVNITITKPEYKEVSVIVYPTQWKPDMASLPVIVAVYDNISYNVKYGKNVMFGVNGIRFSVSCRFDHDNHLDTTIYTVDKGDATVKFKIDTSEGVCIPENFGKRLSRTKELYPLRKNSTGMYDFIILEDERITLNTDGCYISPNGKRYGVFADDTFIELKGL